VDYITPDNSLAGKAHYELIDLITKGLKIITDCGKEKLEEKSANPYIKYLIKNSRIECKESEFQELRSNDKQFFQKVKYPICLYLLTNCDGMLNEYSQKTGNYFFSLSSKLDSLFEERLQNFNVTEQISWDFAKGFFDTHHSIILADPYLFKDDSLKAIDKLMEIVLPKKLVGTYHISLIGSDENKGDRLPTKQVIERWVKSFSEKLNRDVKVAVEFHICNNEDFHDRIIITNNACIFSGIGFGMVKNNSSKKDTTWIGFKPFKRVNTNNNNSVLVYKLMQQKLSTLKSWIQKSNQKTTQNPLFK